MMSAEAETSEIIRRRLFEWHGVPDEAREAIAEYADWILEHRQQIPEWFPVDGGREAFAATYPFHPSVLSVFERKVASIASLPKNTGHLALIALWVSKAYQEGFKGAHRDPLIGIGTAPLEDPMFRAALFEQLGEPRLEGAITTDICGKKIRTLSASTKKQWNRFRGHAFTVRQRRQSFSNRMADKPALKRPCRRFASLLPNHLWILEMLKLSSNR